MMDPRLFPYYESELAHLKEIGAEFAEQYPKIAGRLGLDQFECPDPYVERLLEGFAFMTARIQLKLDAQFPRFTAHLLETVYPHLTAPTPSMTVVRFQPDLTAGNLADGYNLPRGTALRSVTGNGINTSCEYRTAHDVTLWPVTIDQAEYLPSAGAVNALSLGSIPGVRAGLRLRLKSSGGLSMDQLALDRLPIFLQGVGAVPGALLEQILGNLIGVVVRPVERPTPWQMSLPGSAVVRRGYSPEEALLPVTARSFDGYRLLQEYFALPDRFRFFEVRDLQPSLRRCRAEQLELIFLFGRNSTRLDNAVDTENFALFCTPAINLFPKRADRLALNTHDTEFQIVPDRTRPMDFEVHSVLSVTGFGAGVEQEFASFYNIDEKRHNRSAGNAFYSLQRRPVVQSSVRQRRSRSRTSSYIGSEVFISLVDDQEQPYRHNLRQLGAMTLCTNRDLPIEMPEPARTHFTIDQGAPVESIRKAVTQSKPYPPIPDAVTPRMLDGKGQSGPLLPSAWRLISHLSLNYLSLTDSDGEAGAAALRELLSLYAPLASAEITAQIDGIRHMEVAAIVRRLPPSGLTNGRYAGDKRRRVGANTLAYARGLEVAIQMDEKAFEGAGTFVLGSVLEEFFAKYVSLNSFTETVIKCERGEIMRWPARTGRRELL